MFLDDATAGEGDAGAVNPLPVLIDEQVEPDAAVVRAGHLSDPHDRIVCLLLGSSTLSLPPELRPPRPASPAAPSPPLPSPPLPPSPIIPTQAVQPRPRLPAASATETTPDTPSQSLPASTVAALRAMYPTQYDDLKYYRALMLGRRARGTALDPTRPFLGSAYAAFKVVQIVNSLCNALTLDLNAPTRRRVITIQHTPHIIMPVALIEAFELNWNTIRNHKNFLQEDVLRAILFLMQMQPDPSEADVQFHCDLYRFVFDSPTPGDVETCFHQWETDSLKVDLRPWTVKLKDVGFPRRWKPGVLCRPQT